MHTSALHAMIAFLLGWQSMLHGSEEGYPILGTSQQASAHESAYRAYKLIQGVVNSIWQPPLIGKSLK